MQVLLFIGDERHERRGWGSSRLIHCFIWPRDTHDEPYSIGA
jgi:hypothetical protein